MSRRVGQSAPYVVVVGDVLQSAHKTLTTARTKATAAGGKAGVVTGRPPTGCHTFHNVWSLSIGQRVTIDANGRCSPCA
jgi:hypothetical protein